MILTTHPDMKRHVWFILQIWRVKTSPGPLCNYHMFFFATLNYTAHSSPPPHCQFQAPVLQDVNKSYSTSPRVCMGKYLGIERDPQNSNLVVLRMTIQKTWNSKSSQGVFNQIWLLLRCLTLYIITCTYVVWNSKYLDITNLCKTIFAAQPCDTKSVP